jgi:phage gp16-like protein
MTSIIRLIHVGCRALGLDEETRRDLQLRTVGKASLKDMTLAEQDQVLAALKAQGFAPGPGAGAGRKRRAKAGRGDTRFAHVLWGKLHRAGAVDTGGAAGLNAFVRKRFADAWGAVPMDIDTVTDHRQIATVIEALKAMCDRAGISLT